ncbi:hypothetical protein YC2023_037294 [Brassica napus]
MTVVSMMIMNRFILSNFDLGLENILNRSTTRNSRLHRFLFLFFSSSVLIKTSSSESTSFILDLSKRDCGLKLGKAS